MNRLPFWLSLRRALLSVLTFFSLSTPLFAQDEGFGVLPEELDILLRMSVAPPPGAPREARQQVDLRAFFPPPMDQGSQYSCVGFALAYALRTAQERRRNPEWDEPFSPAYHYNRLHRGFDCSNGIYIKSILDEMKRIGNPLLRDAPYSEGNCTDRFSQLSADELRAGLIPGFGSLVNRNTYRPSLGMVQDSLSNGWFVAIAMYIPPAFEDLESGEVFHRTRVYERNLHAMCVAGYDDEKRYGVNDSGEGALLLFNSRGEDWSDNGFGWISYDTFRVLVQEAWVVFNSADEVPPPSFLTDIGLPSGSPYRRERDDQWVFAFSDSELLDPVVLTTLTDEQLFRARNELFLRRGYRFSTERGKGFAELYRVDIVPDLSDSNKVAERFNSTERINLGRILAEERSRKLPDPEVWTPSYSWVLPESSSRRITGEQLKALTEEELWVARNEIFAKQGFVFKSPKGKDLIKKMADFYLPKTESMTEVYDRLNSIEIYNIEMIKEEERSRAR